ncbi:hypothetical protein FNJ84_08365 [Paracoccus sp. M683]|uniref:hypothetical protein n=1 Tax=Paracoccus sp. M683 TaxID=2594268 RepID=UPI00117E23A0|nr:hypothetical protein [Paracoccus sp. M683]TRW97511.1 hypothetical protein FNJ84_08365 [Paracoccus sp. M683]
MQIIDVTHDYDVSPDRLRMLVTDFGALAETMQGRARLYGLPSGRLQQGQVLDVQISLFGVMPRRPYRIEVLECDDRLRHLRSSKNGMGVRRRDHRVRVLDLPQDSRLHDRIELDAGWRTALFAAWVRRMYRARHKPRLRMLAEGRY